jgi:hypothetical protein
LFAAVAHVQDTFAQVKGFKVDIDGAGGKEHDVAWEHVSGGALIIEQTETTIGADKFQPHAPGHKSIDDVVLKVRGLDSTGDPAAFEIGPCGPLDLHICFTIRAPRLPANFKTWLQKTITTRQTPKRDFEDRLTRPDGVSSTILLHECYPAEWTLDGKDGVAGETMRVKCGRIEFKT